MNANINRRIVPYICDTGYLPEAGYPEDRLKTPYAVFRAGRRIVCDDDFKRLIGGRELNRWTQDRLALHKYESKIE